MLKQMLCIAIEWQSEGNINNNKDYTCTYHSPIAYTV